MEDDDYYSNDEHLPFDVWDCIDDDLEDQWDQQDDMIGAYDE